MDQLTLFKKFQGTLLLLNDCCNDILSIILESTDEIISFNLKFKINTPSFKHYKLQCLSNVVPLVLYCIHKPLNMMESLVFYITRNSHYLNINCALLYAHAINLALLTPFKTLNSNLFIDTLINRISKYETSTKKTYQTNLLIIKDLINNTNLFEENKKLPIFDKASLAIYAFLRNDAKFINALNPEVKCLTNIIIGAYYGIDKILIKNTNSLCLATRLYSKVLLESNFS